ncbi:unnamed protein product [Clonostachys rosea]|uniref:Peptidase M43 pregnancy-associated plasma-A domain-containing protein n=1 Tax=Bionectria ochroleuca TaxID=29856 RepID=A0ABY6U4N1_BIOOC|nr:unnamed protein product [Clonostachys rosea]
MGRAAKPLHDTYNILNSLLGSHFRFIKIENIYHCNLENSLTLSGIIIDITPAQYVPEGSKNTPRRQFRICGSLRKGNCSALNVYFLGYGSIGQCSFPQDIIEGSDELYLNGCMVNAQTLPGGSIDGYNLGGTTIHEVGHWFTLVHTFQGGCDDLDMVDDTPAQAWYSISCPIGQDSCPSPVLDPMHNYGLFSSRNLPFTVMRL